MENHYLTLASHRQASPEELKKAYMALAKQYHPDTHNNDPSLAAKMTNLNVAYNTLKHAASRTAYNTKLDLFGKPCAACKGAGAKYAQKGFTRKVYTACKACNGAGAVV